MMYLRIVFFLVAILDLNISIAQVGIGNSTPKNTLEVTQSASNPSSSGSSSNGALRVQGNTNTSLDLGIMTGTSGAWLQSRSSSDYSTKFPLKLNPMGGNVTIGTTTPGTSALHVNGNILATGFIRGAQTGQLLNSVYLTETDLSMTGTIQNNNTTGTDLVSYTYTPVSSNSRIWIKYSANYKIGGNSTAGNDEIAARVLVGGNTLQEKRQYFPTGNSGNGNRSVNLFPISAVYDNTSSSSITIKVDVRRTAGDDVTDTYNDVVFTIMEIAD